jgi:hypothetical protein
LYWERCWMVELETYLESKMNKELLVDGVKVAIMERTILEC